jgi:hypothetical protein
LQLTGNFDAVALPHGYVEDHESGPEPFDFGANRTSLDDSTDNLIVNLEHRTYMLHDCRVIVCDKDAHACHLSTSMPNGIQYHPGAQNVRYQTIPLVMTPLADLKALFSSSQ